jgi:hypothetical protein
VSVAVVAVAVAVAVGSGGGLTGGWWEAEYPMTAAASWGTQAAERPPLEPAMEERGIHQYKEKEDGRHKEEMEKDKQREREKVKERDILMFIFRMCPLAVRVYISPGDKQSLR